MTLRDTQESHAALLTAGAVMLGLGIVIATFRNGLWLGCGLVIGGVVLAVIGTVRARRDWKRPPPPDQGAPRTAERLEKAKSRLDSLMGASGTAGVVALAASVLFPRDERWLLAGISGIIFILAATARFVLERRSDASGTHE
jgi:drug/metabolite transporter (DMT)-like permease